MIKLSVFIITQNEEERLARTIESVKSIADEIIIIDSGSTDNTIQIAKDLGARVFFNKWSGYGRQKKFAESKCKNEWILNLDADEVLTPQLRDEIKALLNSTPKLDAYGFNLILCHRFQKHRHFLAPRTFCIRLYNCTKYNFSISAVHDSVVVSKGQYGKLREYAWHYSFLNYQHS